MFMQLLNFLKRKSYFKDFIEYHQASATSFSWELATVEVRLGNEKDPEKLQELEQEKERIISRIELTKRMVHATKLHDKGKYKAAAEIYNEVSQSGIYYAHIAKKYLQKISA